MQEILPGIFHWSTFHEGIQEYVHSYYLTATTPAVLIDPRLPAQGIDWFKKHKQPEHIYLTNRHHYRHSDQFMNAFNTKIWCHKAGLHEFSKQQNVHPFNHGDELPGGVLALAVGVLCPEETALYIPLGDGTLSIGDAIIRYDNKLGFVPDALMGDQPKRVKKGLKDVFLNHLERKFDNLLFAHGKPWIGDAKKGLRKFLEEISI